MAKSGILRARVEGLLEKRAKAKAEALGLSLTDYLTGLVERDIHHGGTADALARMGAEVNLVSAMMIRRLLRNGIGDEEARTLEATAKENAASIIETILKYQTSGQ